MLESACYLLTYIGDILSAMKHGAVSSERREGAASPPFDDFHDDSDWGEDMNQEDEDSAAEDSDEESLNR